MHLNDSLLTERDTIMFVYVNPNAARCAEIQKNHDLRKAKIKEFEKKFNIDSNLFHIMHEDDGELFFYRWNHAPEVDNTEVYHTGWIDEAWLKNML